MDNGYESDEQYDLVSEPQNQNVGIGRHHPALVDENYLVIGNFIEDHIRQ